MMRKFFITSSGTGIGKTFVTTSLCAMEKNTLAIKPIISGYDPADEMSDTALIMKSCGVLEVEKISPWRFSAPLSPDMAAAREGREIVLNEVVEFCRVQEKTTADLLLVEGVGGVMVPLNDEHTVRDWMVALGWPIILVGGSYLGSISHTLSSVEALAARNLVPRAVVISESADSPVPLAETIVTLTRFLPKTLSIIAIPRQNAQGAMKLLKEAML